MFFASRGMPALVVLAGCASLLGCGMEASDDRVRARAEVGVPDQNALQVLETEYVCPHVVSPKGQQFDPKMITSLKKEGVKILENDVFGPYVPCGTPVTGPGACSGCGNQTHPPGSSGGEDSIEAVPQMKCPYCSYVLDPVALLRRHEESEDFEGENPDRFEPGHCPNCKNYFESAPRDVVTTIDVHEEIVCPSCDKPLDPSLNGCTTSGCALEGVVRNVALFDGPCWRCGGSKICPECGGSGRGSSGPYGNSPAPSDCWFCFDSDPDLRTAESTGRCPECDNDGFASYAGALPPGFKSFQPGPEGKSLESGQRGWKFPADDRAGGGGGGGEEAPSE